MALKVLGGTGGAQHLGSLPGQNCDEHCAGVDSGSWNCDGRQGGSRSHHWSKQGFCSLQGRHSYIVTMFFNLAGNRGGSLSHVDCVCLPAAPKYHDYR